MSNQSDEAVKFAATFIAMALWSAGFAFIIYGCSNPTESPADDAPPEIIEDDGTIFFTNDVYTRSDETVVATIDWLNPLSDIPKQEVTFWCNVEVRCEVVLRDADGNEVGRVVYEPEVRGTETPEETPSRSQSR